MALIPATAYPGQVDSDPAYPHGKARNEVVEGDDTGTPLEAQWVNDILGFLQALLDAAGITPSGTPDTAIVSQYVEAVRYIAEHLDELGVSGSVTVGGSLDVTLSGHFGVDIEVDGDARVEGNLYTTAGMYTSGQAGCSRLSVGGNATCTGDVTIGGKIKPYTGTTTTFSQSVKIEGQLLANVEAGVDGAFTPVPGKCYIANPTAVRTWTLPASAPDGSWVEVTVEHGASGKISLEGFAGGFTIMISPVALGIGNNEWMFCIARKFGGAWHLGPRGS